MIQKINYMVTRVMDGILYPFNFINDFWGILFLSIITSFLVLVVYKYISSSGKIKDTKNQIKGNILAIRLYKDFWKVIVSSFLKSLFYVAKYFALNMVPLIIIIPVLFPMFMQMDVRYGMDTYKVGDEVIVKAKFGSPIDELNIKLLDNEHVKPQMNPVHINALNEVNWKLKAEKDGMTKIRIEIDGNIFEKSLVIGDSGDVLSNRRYSKSSIDHFIYPSETLQTDIPDVEYISIHYPGKMTDFMGFKTYWWIHYLVLVLIIVLAFKNRFGVEF
jgi:hypothetical protein